MIVFDQATCDTSLPLRRLRPQPTDQEMLAVAEVDNALAFADNVLGRTGGKAADGDDSEYEPLG